MSKPYTTFTNPRILALEATVGELADKVAALVAAMQQVVPTVNTQSAQIQYLGQCEMERQQATHQDATPSNPTEARTKSGLIVPAGVLQP